MGDPSEEFADDPHIIDVKLTEWIAWAPLLAGIVLFGIAPGLIFDVTDPAVVDSIEGCLQLANGCEGFAEAAVGG